MRPGGTRSCAPLSALVAALLAGCSSNGGAPHPGAGEAGADGAEALDGAGLDAGRGDAAEAATDGTVGEDAATDAIPAEGGGTDATNEAGTDATNEAGTDATNDAGTDATTDASHDAATDAVIPDSASDACVPLSCAEAFDAGAAVGCGPVSLGCKVKQVCAGQTCGTTDVCAVTAAPIPLSSNCEAIAAADFDGDGALDLAVEVLSGGLNVFPGRGDGTFRAAVTTKLSTSITQLAVSDVNGDGKPDIVAGHVSAAGVAVLLGRGDGTFQELAVPTTYWPRAVAVGDLDGDGKIDVAAAESVASLDLFAGNGDGTFGPKRVLALGEDAMVVQVADVDRDGLPDIVACGPNLDLVRLFRGTGGGAFGPREDLPAALGGVVCGAYDVDHDGWPDLVSVGPTTAAVRRGSSGGFASDLHTTALASGLSPLTLAAVDLNGDGRLDLAMGNRYGSSVTVLQGRTDGTLEAPVTLGTSAAPWGLAAGDWNGDGLPDLASCDNAHSVSVLLGGGCTPGPGGLSGPGAAPCALLVPGGQVQYGVGWLASGDVNGDGAPDVVGASTGIESFLGDGAGGLMTGGSSWSTATYSGLVQDLDGDGRLDVAAVDAKSVLVLLGKGDGTFGIPASFAVSGASQPSPLRAGDLDGDGRVDLVLFAGSTVQVFLNRGAGAFAPPITTALPSAAAALALGDFDGSGTLDVAVALTTSAGRALRVLPGRGDGTFGAARTSALAATCLALEARDLDGDGRLDVAAACGSLYVALGVGDGTFLSPVAASSNLYLRAIAAADLDADGKVDLVADGVSLGQYRVIAFHGAGDGTFTPEVIPAGAPFGPYTIVDLNGDGRSDVVASGMYTYTSYMRPLLSSGCFSP